MKRYSLKFITFDIESLARGRGEVSLELLSEELVLFLIIARVGHGRATTHQLVDSRILPGCLPRLMINKEHSTVMVPSLKHKLFF